MRSTQPQIIYSNSLAELGDALAEHLFADPHPFAKRWVVVPTEAIKIWIQRFFAQKLDVSLGIRFFFLEELIGGLPSELELTLRLEHLLPECEQLKEYLKPGKARAHPLAAKLASHFRNYAIYGEVMLKEWEGWQAELWEKCGAKSWSSLAERDLQGVTLHLFAFNDLPPLYQRYLKRKGSIFYVLSPCAMYWEDARSEGERRLMQRHFRLKGVKEEQLAELDALLRDIHPLIANWGKLGRRLVSHLEQGDPITVERYKEAQQDSQLHKLQGDILLLERSATSPDGSIEIHAAPNRWREVEALHHRLVFLLDQGKWNPSEVLILAPQIEEYFPYLQAVFEREGKIQLQVRHLHNPSKGSKSDGLIALLELLKGRWEASKVCAVLEQLQLSHEEAIRFKEWIDEVGIRWGYDPAHQESYFRTLYGAQTTEFGHSWSEGLDRLSLSWATEAKLDLEDGTLLERIAGWIDRLATYLPLVSSSLTLAEWVGVLDQLALQFLGVQDIPPLYPNNLKNWDLDRVKAPGFDDLNQPNITNIEQVEIVESRELSRRSKTNSSGYLGIEALRALIPSFPIEQFPFSSIVSLMEKQVSKRGETYHRNALDAALCGSMLAMRAIPAKIICLLGMQEGAYPRFFPSDSLDLLGSSYRGDYRPSSADLDRYLFLEALLSAEEHFLVFYPNRDLKEGKPLAPSLLVEELRQEVGVEIQEHPYVPFRFDQFPDKNFSQIDFARAQALYGEKIPQHIPLLVGKGSEDCFELRDLSLSARDPIQLHLRRGLGVEIQEQEAMEDRESFSFSPLQMHRLAFAALEKPLEEVLEREKQNGQIPFGPLGQVSLKQLQRRVEEMQVRLKKYGVEGEVLQTLRFDKQCLKPAELGAGVFEMPPLEITTEGKRVHIVGEIPLVTSQGLLANSKKELKSLSKQWPLFLAYCAADIAPPQLLLMKEERVMISDPALAQEALGRYLLYHVRCLEEPVPLIPQWFESVLTRDEKKLQRFIERDFRGDPFLSPYLRWWMERNSVSLQEVIGRYSNSLEGAFGHLLEKVGKK
ncbi:MAG: exodeoxyribonuclease V subunit gamma [Verrucomicrobia bacterium]|nr:exodeoxyribonuclease V subunit gamma [Verrucomicrobiota bacterium]